METSSASPSTFARAAASSIASGSPSTSGDLGHERQVLGVRLEAGPCRPRPFDEELDGRGARSRGAVIGERERRDGHAGFACHAKRLAARGQDANPGTLREQRRGDPRCLAEHVLTRVEHDAGTGGAKP
jgi:hypothetical protein